jgi:hypothetical protein
MNRTDDLAFSQAGRTRISEATPNHALNRTHKQRRFALLFASRLIWSR